METKNDKSLSYFINSFRLLSLDEFRDAFKELDSFEFNTISSDEYLLHVQQLYDNIEQQTKGDYKFYVNIEDKRMLDVETTVRHVRFDYVSNHCDTIIILFAAYLDSNTGALKDLMQYFDYRVYPKKRGS